MAAIVSFTRHAVFEAVGIDHRGMEYVCAIVKATFSWDGSGDVTVAEDGLPVADEDVLSAGPGSSTLLESDLVPEKPKVDVVLLGAIETAGPVTEVGVGLAVGTRVKKLARVLGDRVWTPSMLSTVPGKARPFTSMPLVWERAFGGSDPDHPETFEARNPVGVGMRRKAESLHDTPAPNFEDPRRPIESWKSRHPPVGFGPVGRWWQPRVRLAGTYDERWQEERFPLAPLDFDSRFYNCAPEDQQLDGYQPDELVTLFAMTAAGGERFRLPAFTVECTFVSEGEEDARADIVPDTIVVEPAQRRFSLVGRACHHPRRGPLAVTEIVVGTPSPAFVRARESGKTYVDRRTSPAGLFEPEEKFDDEGKPT